MSAELSAIQSSAGTARVPAVRLIIGRLVLGGLLVAGWQSMALYESAAIASPFAVAARFVEIGLNGRLLRDAFVTLSETALGFLVGAGLGIALPLLLWRRSRLIAAIEPYVVTAIGIPKLAFAPILILWFGVAMTSKVVLVALMVFFMTFSMTLSGIRTLDTRLIAAMRVLGAGDGTIAREVVWYSALPLTLAAMKIGVPRAFSAAIVGEFLASERGLGRYIAEAQAVADITGVYTGIVAVTLIVLAADLLLARLQRSLLRWQPASRHL